ncbi:hypothetical protein ACIHCX_22185 [Streptomyces sp. NPDC052043]|uniref:hypothetical protein n=1 Tax=Streptomyces sp. NPDC052043 TaxID=3365684 RepID=UPI0037D7B36E
MDYPERRVPDICRAWTIAGGAVVTATAEAGEPTVGGRPFGGGVRPAAGSGAAWASRVDLGECPAGRRREGIGGAGVTTS